MKIYIAGPFTPTGDPEEAARQMHMNFMRAGEAGKAILRLGHLPFVPLVAKHPTAKIPPPFYNEYDAKWLACCDALFLLDHSPQSDKEVAWAEAHGLRVFYSLDDIPVDGARP